MYESFDLYKSYLEQNKDMFPESVYLFASDANRHRLDSPHSLHDSWLTSLTIKENRTDSQLFNPTVLIEIALLGQQHDRDLILRYEDVESYKIEGLKNPYNLTDTFHGDIACHEVTVSDKGLIVHEILFASEAKIIVECKNFTCSEKEYI